MAGAPGRAPVGGARPQGRDPVARSPSSRCPSWNAALSDAALRGRRPGTRDFRSASAGSCSSAGWSWRTRLPADGMGVRRPGPRGGPRASQRRSPSRSSVAFRCRSSSYSITPRALVPARPRARPTGQMTPRRDPARPSRPAPRACSSVNRVTPTQLEPDEAPDPGHLDERVPARPVAACDLQIPGLQQRTRAASISARCAMSWSQPELLLTERRLTGHCWVWPAFHVPRRSRSGNLDGDTPAMVSGIPIRRSLAGPARGTHRSWAAGCFAPPGLQRPPAPRGPEPRRHCTSALVPPQRRLRGARWPG